MAINFDPSGLATPTSTFPSPTPPGTAFSPPAPLSGTEWAYPASQPPLFGATGTPTEQDVVQGEEVGDCFFNADMLQLANKDPDFIKSHIQEVANPTDPSHPNYAVTLYDAQGQAHQIVVDGQELEGTNGQGEVGSGGSGPVGRAWGQGDATALWPTLYEKAFAIANNEGMTELGNGGDPAAAWETLTGEPGTSSPMGDLPSFAQQVQTPGTGTLVGTINNANQLPGWDGTSTTLDNGRYKVTQSPQDSDIMVIQDTQSKEVWQIPCNHTLAVLGLDNPTNTTDGTAQRVNLGNPWGPSLTNEQNLQDVPFSVLQAVCPNIYSVNLPDNS